MKGDYVTIHCKDNFKVTGTIVDIQYHWLYGLKWIKLKTTKGIIFVSTEYIISIQLWPHPFKSVQKQKKLTY